jgi:DNA-directed RNA polymerase beta subunit
MRCTFNRAILINYTTTSGKAQFGGQRFGDGLGTFGLSNAKELLTLLNVLVELKLTQAIVKGELCRAWYVNTN